MSEYDEAIVNRKVRLSYLVLIIGAAFLAYVAYKVLTAAA